MNLALVAANLINAAAFVLYVLILARIVVSWIGINPWNPVVHWLRVIVDPILRPFRRILPTFGGIDFSPLLAILVIFFVARVANDVLVAIAFGGGLHIAPIVVLLIRDVVLNVIIVLAVLVLIRLVLSLFSADPWHPLVMAIRSMTDLLVRPFAGLKRRALRSGVDYPAIAALALYVVLYFVARFLFNLLATSLA